MSPDIMPEKGTRCIKCDAGQDHIMTRKREFLKTVGVTCERGAMQNSIVAAFQHNKVYNGNPGLADREELRRVLRSEIRSLASGYSATITVAEHCQNISSLAEPANPRYGVPLPAICGVALEVQRREHDEQRTGGT